MSSREVLEWNEAWLTVALLMSSLRYWRAYCIMGRASANSKSGLIWSYGRSSLEMTSVLVRKCCDSRLFAALRGSCWVGIEMERYYGVARVWLNLTSFESRELFVSRLWRVKKKLYQERPCYEWGVVISPNSLFPWLKPDDRLTMERTRKTWRTLWRWLKRNFVWDSFSARTWEGRTKYPLDFEFFGPLSEPDCELDWTLFPLLSVTL